MELSESRGAAKEGESRSAQSKLVGEGQGVSLEVIRRVYVDVNEKGKRLVLGHVGKSNVAGNTFGIRIVEVTQ